MRYVPASGPKTANIVFVGEAPGEKEEEKGVPFIGISGQRLREDCAKAGVDIDKCYITNVCKYRPPYNDIDKFIKRSKRTDKSTGKKVNKLIPNTLVLNGIAELYRDLAEIKPTVVVPLGNIALWALTGNELISRRRGSIYQIQPNLQLLEQFPKEQIESVVTNLQQIIGIKVVPTLHPAYIERNMVMQPIFRLDLRRVAEEAKTRELNLPQRLIHVNPDEATARVLAGRLLASEEYAADIETPGGKLFCVGYSADPSWALVLGTDTLWKMEIHRMLLENPISKVFQNGIYDCSFLLRENNIHVGGYGYDYTERKALGFDTMFAQHAVYPEWRVGLDFLCSVFTREPYYKDEGKNHDLSEFEDVTTYMRYCGKDACNTLEIARVQRVRELKDPHFRQTFEYTMSQVPLIIDIQTRGMKIDLKEMERLREESRAVSQEVQRRFDASVLQELIQVMQSSKKPEVVATAIALAEKIASNLDRVDKKDPSVFIGGFNVYSSPDCQKYLYDIRGFRKIYKKANNEEGEAVTADEEAIKAIYGDTGDPKLLELITLRRERKLQTSYYRLKTLPNGTTFFSINPVGTKSDRWSVSQDLQGYGHNMQTLPGKTRSMVVAEEGCSLIYLDLSQAEDRIVSYMAKVLKKIKAFEEGIDVHSLTAALIFGVSMDEVIREHKEHKSRTGKEGPKRFLGKQSNHAFNYGEGPITFTKKINKKADETGVRVTAAQSKVIRNGHLRAYPEIRWYWQDIEAQLKSSRTLIAPRIGDEKYGRKRRFAGRLNDETFREAYSFIPQSVPPDIINRAMVDIHHQLVPRIGDPRARLLLQVHDAILFQAPTDGAEQIAEEIVKYMEIPVEIHGKDIIIPADYKIGKNWKAIG